MGGRDIDADVMDLARHGETRPCLRRPARGRRLATVRGTPGVRDGHFATYGFNPGSGTVSRPARRTPPRRAPASPRTPPLDPIRKRRGRASSARHRRVDKLELSEHYMNRPAFAGRFLLNSR